MSAREQLDLLMKQREDMEAEIGMIVEVLNSPTPSGTPGVGIKGNLLDDEGYPRNDIDIHNIRTLRNRLAILQTDHKETMKEIENLLVTVHAEMRESGQVTSNPAPASHTESQPQVETPNAPVSSASTPPPSVPQQEEYTPFALIDEIFPGSPAEEAGLQVGDRVIDFGGLKVEVGFPAPSLRDLVPIVRMSENCEVSVKVYRYVDLELKVVDLTLIPKRWSGTGTLGCHLNPIN